MTEAEWQNLSVVWAQPLATLFPRLRDLRNDLTEGDVGGYASTAIFEAIRNLLSHMAQTQPWLLFMDDAHWADETSLSLLAYLIQQSSRGMEHGGMVITSRIEVGNEALQRIVLNLQSKELRRIDVSRLNDADTSALVFYALRKTIPKTLVDCLLKETGGNTFLLLEMLRAILAMQNRGELTTCDELPVSADMENLLRGRLQNLSEAAGNVLYTAAIQGSPFDLMTLEKAVSLSVDGLIDAIEELEQAQLIRNMEQSPTASYIFVHELLRDALIADLSEVRKRSLHKKIAEALETLQAGQTAPKAAVLAQHYAEAGENSRAFDYWVQAGLYAYQLFSIKDATLAYQHAQRLISQTVLQDRQIYDLYARWSDMAFDNDDADLLETLNQRFLELGKERGSDLLIGTALDGLSDACMARNQFTEGLEYTRKAIPYLELSGNLNELMTTHSHRGVFLYMLNRFDAAEEHLRTVLKRLPVSHDRRSFKVSGDINYHLATVSVGMGWPIKGVAYAERSLRELRLSRWPYGPVMAHSMLGLANYYRVDYEPGRKHALESVALAKRIDGWRMLGYAYAYAGMNETELALLGPAWDHAQKAIDIGTKYGHPEIVSMGYRIIGDIYTRLSALKEAAQAYQQGVKMGGETFMALENSHRLGVSWALLGNPAGEVMLDRVINEAQAVKLDSISTYARALRLSLSLAKKDFAFFDEEVESVAEEFRQRTNPDALAWTDYLKAAAAFQRGDAGKALHLLQALKPIFQRTPMFWIELRALNVHVQVLRELRRDTAQELMRIREMFTKTENFMGEAPILTQWQAFQSKYNALNGGK
ncbi:MAG: AAA family ATPase [Anaerolineales bacterium]|nr:AAA family ATPase [Anaerolineales bacterium]